MRFFTKFEGHQPFYSAEELVVLINFFTRSAGRVDLRELIDTLSNVCHT